MGVIGVSQDGRGPASPNMIRASQPTRMAVGEELGRQKRRRRQPDRTRRQVVGTVEGESF